MSRPLANVSRVRFSAGAKHPFIVERLENLREHLRGGPRVLRAHTSYTLVRVGRFETAAQAAAAAHRSARRCGGYMRSLAGKLYPEGLPYAPPAAPGGKVSHP